MTPVTSYRLAVGVALATVLLLLFGIGALGVIGDGGPADRVYLAVLAVLVVGSLLARFRPRGMALTLLATALTQVRRHGRRVRRLASRAPRARRSVT